LQLAVIQCFTADVKGAEFVFHFAANYVFTINFKTMKLQPEMAFQTCIALAGNKLLTLTASDSTTWKFQRFCLPV